MEHAHRELEVVGGLSLHVESWKPPAAARCVIVVSHGAASHVGRFDGFARTLGTRLCATVFGADHRGQGRSGGKRGHIDSFDAYAADLSKVVLMARTESGAQLPCFVFAHSMGGLIALHAALAGVLDDVRGLVLSGPLLQLAEQPPAWKRFVGRVAAFAAPRLTLPAGIPASYISRDEQAVAAYEQDTRRVPVVSARWYASMNNAREGVFNRIHTFTLPCLWYIGTSDRICAPDGSRRAFSRLANPDAHDQTLREWGDYYHELHNEALEHREPVLNAICEWIAPRINERRLSSSSA